MPQPHPPRTPGPSDPGAARTRSPRSWRHALRSPAVPALTATAVVGLAAGALWAQADLTASPTGAPGPTPTVTLVRTVPAPAPSGRPADRAVPRAT